LLIHHEIATNVGGTPIFDPLSDRLIPPRHRKAFADNLIDSINHLETMRMAAGLLRKRTPTNFSRDDRVEGGIDTYRAALTARKS